MSIHFINQWNWYWEFWGDYTLIDISIYKDPFPNRLSLQFVLFGLGFTLIFGGKDAR